MKPQGLSGAETGFQRLRGVRYPSAVHAVPPRSFAELSCQNRFRPSAGQSADTEDVYTQNRRLWVRLREKGGKRHLRGSSKDRRGW